MNESLIFDNKKFISAKNASLLTGYTTDYIGQLSRGNKINSRRVGRAWYVEEESLLHYANHSDLVSSLGSSAEPKISETVKSEDPTKLSPQPSPQISPVKFSMPASKLPLFIFSLLSVFALLYTSDFNLLSTYKNISFKPENSLVANLLESLTSPTVNISDSSLLDAYKNYVLQSSTLVTSKINADSLASAFKNYVLNPALTPNVADIANAFKKYLGQPTPSSNLPLAKGETPKAVGVNSSLKKTTTGGVSSSGSTSPKIIYLTGPAGPQGPKGEQGEPGEPGKSVTFNNPVPVPAPATNYTPMPSYYANVGIIPPNPSINYAGGSIASATDLSSTNFISNNAKITTLDISGNSNLAGSLALTGSATLSGALTLHGATTLDNSFSQTGANTFSTGTGAISLNGATSVTGSNTFNVGTGLTTLGGDLTVTGTAWTATPTISGLVTATSGLTSNGALTLGNNSNFSQTGTGTFSTGTGAVSLHGATTLDNSFSQTGANTFSTGTGAISLNGDTTLTADKNFSQTGTGTFSTGTGAVSLNGATTVTGSNTFTTGTGALTLNNVTTNLTATNPILDLTSASTLSINTTTNRPVSFGTGNITIPNLYVTNYEQNSGTSAITSSVPTGTIFSVTDHAITNGTLIGNTLTANAGNGQVSNGQIITVTDATTAGGGYTGLAINVSGAGTGSGEKNVLDLNPGTNQRVVFDNAGSFRPTTSVASNTNTIGSPGFYWKNGYFDQVTANNIAGVVTSGATSSTSWTIGSTQATDVNESLIFYRNNLGAGNATLQWNAGTSDLRYFTTNYPFNTTYTVNDASISSDINLLSGNLTNNTTSGTQKLLSLTNTGTGITENGIYLTNTGTGVTALEIAGTWTNGIVTNNNSINAGTGSVSGGAGTFAGVNSGSGLLQGTGGLTITGTVSLPNASITNAYLANSSITVGTTNIALGASSTTLAGLTSVSSTGFTGALTGNADTATKLATTKNIYGNAFDGSADLTQIIASTYGGTGNGFTKFTGPTTAERTFTLPDSNATLLYSGGALGTPSSGTLTNATGLPAAAILAGTFGTGAYTMDTSLTNPLLIGGANTTSTLTLQTTSGVGTTGADMHFNVGNNGATKAMTILNSGNVGIGTTAPSNQLHLYGTTDSGITIERSGWAAAVLKLKGSRDGINEDLGVIQFLNGANITSRIEGVLPSDADADSGVLSFITYKNASPAIRMKIDENGNVSMLTGTLTVSGTGDSSIAGNVGIGTTGPGQKLDVLGSGIIFGADDATPTLRTDATTKSAKLYLPHYTNNEEGVLIFTGSSTATVNDIAFGGGTSTGNAATNIRFFTAANSTTVTGTERMRIDTTGNVGIGTTNPGGRLEVSSGTAGVTVGDLLLDINNATGSNVVYIGRQSSTDSDNTILNVRNRVGVSKLYLNTGNGNVGIGTTSPLSSLHVAGDGTITVYDGSARGLVQSKSSSSAYSELRFAGNDLSFYTASTDGGSSAAVRMTIKNTTGNVGIGTTAPNTKLDVYGASDSPASGHRGVFQVMTDTMVGLDMGAYTASPYATWIQSQDGRDGTTYPLVLNPVGGNVGIGTTNPGQKLHIVGTARFAGANTSLDIAQLTTTQMGITAATNLHFRTGSAAVMQFSINTTEMMRIGANGGLSLGNSYVATDPGAGNMIISGNVGIGTTGPSEKLDVLGNVLITGNTKLNGLVGIGGDVVTGTALRVNHAALTGTSQMGILSSPTFTSSATVQAQAMRARVNTQAAAFTVPTASGLLVEAGTTGAGSTITTMYGVNVEAMTQGSTNYAIYTQGTTQSYFGGNVGIGNVAPLSKLGITGNASIGATYGAIVAPTSGLIIEGNVGIGTTAPKNPLSVLSGVSSVAVGAGAGTAAFIGHNYYYSGGWKYTAADYMTAIDLNDGNAGNVQFYSAVSGAADAAITLVPTMKITNLGNVGIGTTAPGALLHVWSSTAASAVITLQDTNGDANAPVFNFRKSSVSPANDDEVGRIYMYGKNASAVEKEYGLIRGIQTDVTAGSEDSRLEFLTLAAGSQVSTLALNSGNVGIGTTDPGAALDVVGNIRAANGATNSYLIAKTTGTSVNSAVELIGAGTSDWLIGTNRGDIWGSADTLAFYKNQGTAGAKMVIQDNGNVGIGTTAPGSKLTVNGDITMPSGQQITVGVYGTSGLQLIGQTGDVGIIGTIGANEPLVFRTVADEKMRITAAGSVGIGTTAPGAKLDVWDGNLTLSDTDVAHGITSFDATAVFGALKPLSGTAGGLRVNALSDTDAEAFHLYGLIGSADPTDTKAAIVLDGGKANGVSWQALGAAETVFQLDNFSVPLVTVLGGGNVGIGTTSPGSMLTVGTATTNTGDITVYGTGTTCTIGNGTGATNCTSDVRLKDNITTLGNELSNIMALRPVTFNWKDPSRNQILNTGLIAQEVQNIYPNMVHVVYDDYLGIDYAALVVPAIKAIQELNLNLEAVAGTVTPVPGSASESFLNAFLSNIYSKIGTWLADATNGIGEVFANVFNAKEKICVDGECLTKDDIKALLQMAHASGAVSAPVADITTPPAGTPPPQGGDGSAISSPPDAGGVLAPSEGGGSVVDVTTPPLDTTIPPVDTTTPPADTTTPSADTTTPPADTATPPAETTAPATP